MIKKHNKQVGGWLFDQYRTKYWPDYSFKWEQAQEQIAIDPSRFIFEGTLYEVSETPKKPRHYILTLDMLIALPMVELSRDVKKGLKKATNNYYLKLINPRLQKINYEGRSGIRLIANNLAQNFTCKSKNDMQRWFEALKRVCVLENLEESYDLKQFIGSGSSAVVRIGTKINDPSKTYAIKSFPKKNYTDRVYSFVIYLDNTIENIDE